jgi:hypothetical protein
MNSLMSPSMLPAKFSQSARRQNASVRSVVSPATALTPHRRRQIRIQGAFTTDNYASEIAMHTIDATKFPVQQLVTHTFQLGETEKRIRAVGAEIARLYPVKTVIKR